MLYILGNPIAIHNTLWLQLVTVFGIRGRKAHHGMLWGDIELKEENGKKKLYHTERATKTRNGIDLENVPAYKAYIEDEEGMFHASLIFCPISIM